MSSHETMIPRPGVRARSAARRATLALLASLSLLSFSSGSTIFAQQHFSKRYPARRNVRLQLNNQAGTIVVQGWARDEIRVSANIWSPGARCAPEPGADGMVIDVARDNRGRDEVGDIDFTIMVPINSSVDLQTRRGNIKVSNVRGALVRAHVSSEGDVELSEIRSSTVMASNTMGNIFFDGELTSEGTYDFKSGQGDINIRIPANSSFRLVASAPFTRNITLGAFWNDGLKKLGDGRKIVGDIGDGQSLPLLSVMNYRGSISFIGR